jgi:hypothetical protein
MLTKKNKQSFYLISGIYLTYIFIIPHIKKNKINFLIFLKCRPKSFGNLQTFKIHAIFKKKHVKVF